MSTIQVAELNAALKAYDYDTAERITATLCVELDQPGAVSDEELRDCFNALRSKRKFRLMIELAEAAIKVNRATPRVRRQLAQGLIEEGRFDRAHELLDALIADPHTGEDEMVEALGLRGRAFKQAFIDGKGEGERGAATLEDAIKAYVEGYELKPKKNLWHGVNAVSLLRRREREGFEPGIVRDAQRIARAILTEVEDRERQRVWDLASAAEACLGLENDEGKFESAAKWLEQYSTHPYADSFELSSTTRQFSQVLQLEDSAGSPLLEELRAEGLTRAGGGFVRHELNQASDSPTEAGATVPVMLRVTEPSWQYKGKDRLEIISRWGVLIAARVTERNLEALLEDPAVVAIDSSRGVQELDEGLALHEREGFRRTIRTTRGRTEASTPL